MKGIDSVGPNARQVGNSLEVQMLKRNQKLSHCTSFLRYSKIVEFR